VDPEISNAIQPALDQIAEIADQQFASSEIHKLLRDLATVFGKGKIASLTLAVDVFDEDRERSLPLLTTGLSAFVGKEPFRTWGDSTLQRYVIDEGIQVVPHDRCPACWRSGISNSCIPPVGIVASRWETNASCCWTPMNAPTAMWER